MGTGGRSSKQHTSPQNLTQGILIDGLTEKEEDAGFYSVRGGGGKYWVVCGWRGKMGGEKRVLNKMILSMASNVITTNCLIARLYLNYAFQNCTVKTRNLSGGRDTWSEHGDVHSAYRASDEP